MQRAAGFVVTALSLLTMAAHAGPPYQTDDPEPVALHRYEINIATQQSFTSAGHVGTLPGVEINYGGTPNLQLHLGLPIVVVRPTSGMSHIGPGDVEFGAKYRFVQETDTTTHGGNLSDLHRTDRRCCSRPRQRPVAALAAPVGTEEQ